MAPLNDHRRNKIECIDHCHVHLDVAGMQAHTGKERVIVA